MKKIKHIIHFIAAFAAFCYCQGQAQAQAVFQRVYLDSKYENCVGAYGY